MIVTIDDRSLLFALDRLYRQAMQGFERTNLLVAARRVAEVLGIAVANLAPEGYYATDPALTEYFRLMRALQAVPESREHEVAGVPEFRRLWDVANSRIYGHPDREGKLLPQGIDALGRALLSVAPEWTVARIVPAARAAAIETDDYSLVGLAARVEDAVVLTALRESVALCARVIRLGLEPRPTFEWKVNPGLAKQANRFVQAFNALVPDALPSVIPANARLSMNPTGASRWWPGGACALVSILCRSRYGITIGRSARGNAPNWKSGSSGPTSCGRRSVTWPSALGVDVAPTAEPDGSIRAADIPSPPAHRRGVICQPSRGHGREWALC